jgi:hypothetical protein
MPFQDWLRGLSRQRHQIDSTETFVLTDASTVHGAGRHYFDYHNNPTWEYAAQYNAAEDKLLFHEFLHNILLYDRIFLDNACSRGDEILYEEVQQITRALNDMAGYELLRRDAFAPETPLDQLLDVVCRALRPRHPSEDRTALLSTIRIPWYYATERHVDYPCCAEAAARWGLDARFIPLALYIYRGLCYSGWANNHKNREHVPTVYLASPGRLQALQPILSKSALRQAEYPHSAYADLVSLLDLPTNGYDFTQLELEPAHTSKLAMVIARSDPREALELVLKIRNSSSGNKVRKAWRKRIWAASASCAVGSATFNGPVNLLSGNIIHGDVTQYIHAVA